MKYSLTGYYQMLNDPNHTTYQDWNAWQQWFSGYKKQQLAALSGQESAAQEQVSVFEAQNEQSLSEALKNYKTAVERDALKRGTTWSTTTGLTIEAATRNAKAAVQKQNDEAEQSLRQSLASIRGQKANLNALAKQADSLDSALKMNADNISAMTGGSGDKTILANMKASDLPQTMINQKKNELNALRQAATPRDYTGYSDEYTKWLGAYNLTPSGDNLDTVGNRLAWTAKLTFNALADNLKGDYDEKSAVYQNYMTLKQKAPPEAMNNLYPTTPDAPGIFRLDTAAQGAGLLKGGSYDMSGVQGYLASRKARDTQKSVDTPQAEKQRSTDTAPKLTEGQQAYYNRVSDPRAWAHGATPEQMQNALLEQYAPEVLSQQTFANATSDPRAWAHGLTPEQQKELFPNSILTFDKDRIVPIQPYSLEVPKNRINFMNSPIQRTTSTGDIALGWLPNKYGFLVSNDVISKNGQTEDGHYTITPNDDGSATLIYVLTKSGEPIQNSELFSSTKRAQQAANVYANQIENGKPWQSVQKQYQNEDTIANMPYAPKEIKDTGNILNDVFINSLKRGWENIKAIGGFAEQAWEQMNDPYLLQVRRELILNKPMDKDVAAKHNQELQQRIQQGTLTTTNVAFNPLMNNSLVAGGMGAVNEIDMGIPELTARMAQITGQLMGAEVGPIRTVSGINEIQNAHPFAVNVGKGLGQLLPFIGMESIATKALSETAMSQFMKQFIIGGVSLSTPNAIRNINRGDSILDVSTQFVKDFTFGSLGQVAFEYFNQMLSGMLPIPGTAEFRNMLKSGELSAKMGLSGQELEYALAGKLGTKLGGTPEAVDARAEFEKKPKPAKRLILNNAEKLSISMSSEIIKYLEQNGLKLAPGEKVILKTVGNEVVGFKPFTGDMLGELAAKDGTVSRVFQYEGVGFQGKTPKMLDVTNEAKLVKGSDDSLTAFQKMMDEVEQAQNAGMTARDFAKSKGVPSTFTDQEAALLDKYDVRMQSHPTGENFITGSLDDLPSTARNTYKSYESNGWKGNFRGQTPGTSAAGTYLNGNEFLPTADSSGKPITYKEFDVNNHIPGVRRDAERFVVGSDDSVYYTDSHYGERTSPLGLPPFVKIK